MKCCRLSTAVNACAASLTWMMNNTPKVVDQFLKLRRRWNFLTKVTELKFLSKKRAAFALSSIHWAGFRLSFVRHQALIEHMFEKTAEGKSLELFRLKFVDSSRNRYEKKKKMRTPIFKVTDARARSGYVRTFPVTDFDLIGECGKNIIITINSKAQIFI